MESRIGERCLEAVYSMHQHSCWLLPARALRPQIARPFGSDICQMSHQHTQDERTDTIRPCYKP
jgi:hypothetical protein